MSNIILSQDIQSLINNISNEIEIGRIKLKTVQEKEKSISYWNIGRHIYSHLLKYSDKPNYGNHLFSQIAEYLNIGERSLYFAYQFYKSYQNFDYISNHLTWTHFKILLTVKSNEKRKQYEKILLEQKLSTRDFFNLVKKDKDNLITYKGDHLSFHQGVPYLYVIKTKNDESFLDLGFHIYSDSYSEKLTDLNLDSILQASKNSKGYSFKAVDYEHSYLYTYKAFITKVIDGDSIKADIDLGFNIIINKTLRLRGVNAFEISTAEGKKAKDFVQARLKNLDFIVIKTYQPDKYSRYLADVFYLKDSNDIYSIIESGRFFKSGTS